MAIDWDKVVEWRTHCRFWDGASALQAEESSEMANELVTMETGEDRPGDTAMSLMADWVRRARSMSTKGRKMATPVIHKAKYSIVVLGRGGVGKSALILRFLYDEFVEDYEPTKADCYQKKMTLKTHGEVVLEVLDTAGEEMYPSSRENLYRIADGFLLVFSVSDPDSLHSLKELNEEILRVRGDGAVAPCLVVATKCDLSRERKVHSLVPCFALKVSIERLIVGWLKVSLDEIKAVTAKWDIPFVETSARTKYNVAEVFIEITQQMKFHKTEGCPTSSAEKQDDPSDLPAPDEQDADEISFQAKLKRTWRIFHKSARKQGKKIKASVVRNGRRFKIFIEKKTNNVRRFRRKPPTESAESNWWQQPIVLLVTNTQLIWHRICQSLSCLPIGGDTSYP